LRDTGATAARDVGSKIRIAGEQLVGALPGHDRLHTGAHRPRQKEFGSTVGIDDRNLAMPNRILKIVGDVLVADRHNVMLNAEARCRRDRR